MFTRKTVLTLVGRIPCKVSHNLSSCKPPIARKTFWITLLLFYDFGGWTAHQTVFSVACNSDSEIQCWQHSTVVDSGLYPKTSSRRRYVSEVAGVVGPCKDFVAIWIPVGLSSGLSLDRSVADSHDVMCHRMLVYSVARTIH